MRTLINAILLVLILGSCGLKGPLYLPQDTSSDQEQSKMEGQEN